MMIVNLGDVEKEKKFVSDYFVMMCPDCVEQIVKEGNRNKKKREG